MGSGDEATPRRLNLERETLRDLSPSVQDMRNIRGADDDSTSGRSTEPCVLFTEAMAMLGKTFMSYGCAGRIRWERTENGHEMHVDLQPNKQTAEIHEIAKHQAITRDPELGERLDRLNEGL